MRICGGTAKGTRLVVPKGIRPASEKVRLAVMTSLGSATEKARVLDLFCGSGAWGLEALSRGAASAVFVDRDPAAISACRSNVDAAGMSAQATVRRLDAGRYLETRGRADGPFDLVFADPPYTSGPPSGRTLRALEPLLSPDGRVIWETGRGAASVEPDGAWLVDERRYGDTRVLMLQPERT